MSHPEEAWNIRRIGHSDLNGHGDGMQLMTSGQFIYVGHVKGNIGTSIVDFSNPAELRVVNQLPCPANTHKPKVQISGDLLLVNFEQFPSTAGSASKVGFQILDISDRLNPLEIGFFETGGRGVHRIWYSGGETVYISVRVEGYNERILMLVDISEPNIPKEISRWWFPGMWVAGNEKTDWPVNGQSIGVHHAIVHNDRAYAGFWGGGMLILDISDPSKPGLITHTKWKPGEGGSTHTAMPLPKRNLLVVTDESTADNCKEEPRRVRLFDISDEKKPRLVSMFPEPRGNFCERGGRFGPHNVHENRPGAYCSDRFIYVTYFNAGLRVFDIDDPKNPQEIAYYLPPCPQNQKTIQTNDVFVAENGLIFISDRLNGGIDILEMV